MLCWFPKEANTETKTKAETGDRAPKREAALLHLWLCNSQRNYRMNCQSLRAPRASTAHN